MGCFPAPEVVTDLGPAEGSGLEGGYSVTHFIEFHAQAPPTKFK